MASGKTMRVLNVFGVLLFLYISTVAAAYLIQRDLIFHPSNVHIAPMDIKLFDIQEITLNTPDGANLIAWYAPPEVGKQTLFYLHGNAGALFQRASRIRLYRASGYGVFMLAYRGFSGSTGSPS